MTRQDGLPERAARPAHLSDSAAAKRSESPTSMTRAEQDRLAVCEAVIDEGLRTFVEVGVALATIRDERLYRHTHSTFADYAHERFGLSRAHSYRMIDAAKVVEVVSPNGGQPLNERQARELVPLLDDPDRLREVVAKAEAGGKITAASLRAAREHEQAEAEWLAVEAETTDWTARADRPSTYEDCVAEARSIIERLSRSRLAFARLIVTADDAERADWERLAREDPDLLDDFVWACQEWEDGRPDVLAALAFLQTCGIGAL